MSNSYPKDGAIIEATVKQWDDRWLVAHDANGLPYCHWFEDDSRWSNIWEHHLGWEDLRLKIRVGRTDGPRGRKCFIVTVRSQQPSIYEERQKELPVSESVKAKAPQATTVASGPLGLNIKSAEPRHYASVNVELQGPLAAIARLNKERTEESYQAWVDRNLKAILALQGVL